MVQKFISLKNNSPEFLNKVCFINNIRSKYLTVALLLIAVMLTSYDVIILQKTSDFHFFLYNFKTDLILLVASFIFMVYIFFNQVKSAKEIRSQHKITHGTIALFILGWSAFKTSIFIGESNVLYIFIFSIIAVSVIYIFPISSNIGQLFFSVIVFCASILLNNIKLNSLFHYLLILLFFYTLSIVINKYIYNLHTRIFLKDIEIKK